jgi:hypothetical protein
VKLARTGFFNSRTEQKAPADNRCASGAGRSGPTEHSDATIGAEVFSSPIRSSWFVVLETKRAGGESNDYSERIFFS